MKKLLMLAAVILTTAAVSSLGIAATNVRIAANIGDTHSLNVALNKVVGATWTVVSDLVGTGMDFGTLVQGPDSNFRSNSYFAIDAPVTSNHASWSITHTRTDFIRTGGVETLNGNVNVTFVKVDTTTSAETQLSGGYVSYQASNNKIINSSDLTNARLRIYYGIANGSGDASGVTLITTAKPQGQYTGTVTLTLSP